MWMIEPPPAFAMCGIAQRLMRKAPPRLTAKTRFQAARSRSVTVALGSVIAAPLTSTCMVPKAFTACSTAARVSDSEDTSQRIGRNRLASTLLTSMSTHATCAPASLNASAIAAPMPPTPATIADLPRREYLSCISPTMSLEKPRPGLEAARRRQKRAKPFRNLARIRPRGEIHYAIGFSPSPPLRRISHQHPVRTNDTLQQTKSDWPDLHTGQIVQQSWPNHDAQRCCEAWASNHMPAKARKMDQVQSAHGCVGGRR